MKLLKAIGDRLARILPTVFAVILLNFFLLKLAPGDAADVIAGEHGYATPETMAALRAHMGLDIPIWRQLLNYLTSLAQLDLGFSHRFNAPVLDVILSRLPATLLLMLTAYVLAVVLGILSGVAMATWRGRWPDKALSFVTLLFYSMPSFWIGVMLIVLFSVQLGWLPSDGDATVGFPLSGWDAFADRAAHLILPAAALSLHFLAIYARLTRAAMLEALDQDFVRTAKAKGVHPIVITFRHVLRNALIPVSTVAGLHLGNLLGGAATVELVFSWPGLGRLALDSVQARDFTMLLGILLLSSLLVIAANVIVDLVQAWIDPRTRRDAQAVRGPQIQEARA
jgi:peptide/nickel transport system permease protein